ncbi:hypothetical protein CXB51_006604 [Gossypium anomalum]|uniref:DC1 domain-containing protein n=1 Tax=Gossypium anomalum TaxID=47600 RepID=A0A8J6DCW2_9ROSI|nr:hypothetical protein CXB51_006604 [Gossypium anomalum]
MLEAQAFSTARNVEQNLEEDKLSYSIVSLENEDEMPNESFISVIERNDAGEATKIKHFKHMHNLMLSPFVGGYENSCEGCMLPISDPFYYCPECGFFLHKACAELPKMMNVWYHICKEPLTLISDKAFKCRCCHKISNAFAYECCRCEVKICLRCVIAHTPGAQTCLKHEHPLFSTDATRGNAMLVVDHRQYFVARIAILGYIYSKSHHCDICEKSRDPNGWFYHCATCDTSAHVGCVLGSYPFLKLESIYEETDHPHPLTIVKKKYCYPDCDECGEPCEDVALECSKSECKYIVHWDCVAPNSLQSRSEWPM